MRALQRPYLAIYNYSVNYIEGILREQLITAIGKEIGENDMHQFVKYHSAKLVNPAPKPFCHAIRRPGHYPDGLLSIECVGGDKM